MAMARESEIETQSRQVVILCDEIERPSEPQAEMIPIKRHTFHLLEHLREIYTRVANGGGEISERPASRQVSGKHQLGAIDKPAPGVGGAGRRRSRGSKRASYEG